MAKGILTGVRDNGETAEFWEDLLVSSGIGPAIVETPNCLLPKTVDKTERQQVPQ